MEFTRRAALTGLLLTLCNATAIWADVKPAALFGNHMVLQQGMLVPVWGWADPGEPVAVSIAGQTQTTTAGRTGDGWSASTISRPRRTRSR